MATTIPQGTLKRESQLSFGGNLCVQRESLASKLASFKGTKSQQVGHSADFAARFTQRLALFKTDCLGEIL